MRATWWGAITGLLLGVVLGVTLLLVRDELPWRGEPVTGDATAAAETAAVATTTDRAATIADSLQFERDNAIVRATRMVAPAVVSISVIQLQATRDPRQEFFQRLGWVPRQRFVRPVQNMGSGLIVSADGLIVTNRHVVAGAAQIGVTLSDGSQYPAEVVDEVERYDLAVLRIDGANLPVATFAVEADLQIGEWAIAIGSPFGLLLADTQPTVTVGVISALNRDIKKNDNDQTAYLGMIQTDAAINPGNSGGPLVNTRGEVVGINTFIFSESGGSVGIGFAVPAARVRTVLDEILRYGRYRDIDLGFGLVRLNQAAMQYLNTEDPAGVAVYEVRQDSPAWKAGLRPEDILRQMGGQQVTSLSLIERLVYNSNVGTRLTFRAERAGESWDGAIILEERR
ncbi:MAG: trypsin-like serine protease [bacterium]|nr:trypsin-like serine protease [bacterium]